MEARAKLEEKTAMEMVQAAEKEQKKFDREIKKRLDWPDGTVGPGQDWTGLILVRSSCKGV
jgi:hypothetical protein